MENEIQPINANLLSQKKFKYFDIIFALFIAIYLISQVSAVKIFKLGPFNFPGAIIVFPISYIFGDILTEVYGFARSRRVIWTGFFSAIIMSFIFLIVQYLPPSPYWPNQTAYETILGLVPRVVIGSILAFWAGEFSNSFVLAKMKIWTKGKYLWTRTIGSTIVGEGIDSLIFITIAFGGTMPIIALFKIIGSIYLFKVLYEVVATPITYKAVKFLKKEEGIDVYDHETNFTPFRIGVE